MKIALLPWGNVIEDYLNHINVSIESFCTEMTGGWLFGYIEALQKVGIQTVLVCVSNQVRQVTYRTHTPSGAQVILLPALGAHRFVRRISQPVNQNAKTISWLKWLQYPFLRSLSDIEPYLATPPLLLKRVLEQENCQAILCQEYEYPRFDICVMLGKLLKLSVYASFQGGNFQTSRIESFMRPHTLQACNGLIVATQTEIHRLQSTYGLETSKIGKIFNPLDLNLWKKQEADEPATPPRVQVRNDLNLPQDAIIVICHGRVDIYRKGLDILLKAWGQLTDSARSAQKPYLLLIGTGQDAEDFQKMIDEKALKNVIWINQYILDRTVMNRYLSAADLYVLPSRHEGFPVAPLEAMACGLPIVATEVSGIPDILEKHENSGGIRVPVENPEKLALALARLLDNPDLRLVLGQNSRQRVKAAFSPTSVGKNLQKFMFPGVKTP